MTANKTKKAPATEFDAALLGASAADAVDAVAKANERGPLLVEAWVETKNAAAVAAVAEDDRAPAAARKAARRGLNVLKARGVAVPERTRIARLAGDAVEGYEAWLVAPDGGGTSLVLIAARWQSGKYHIVHTTLRDGVGLLEVRALEMSRSQLRNSFDESARRMGHGPVPVPVDWARFRVAAAQADNAKSGAILPFGISTHAEILGPAPSEAPTHPIDAANLDLSDADALVRTSAELHRHPEFGSWMPPAAAIQELLVGVGEKLGGSGSENDQAKVEEAISGALDLATDRFFGPEMRERLADRMKDAAISIMNRADQRDAAQVMATAAAMRSAGLITSPPHEIPFLRGFFQKALAIIATQSGGQISVPVPAPSEGNAGPAAVGGAPEGGLPGERVSPGGIILP